MDKFKPLLDQLKRAQQRFIKFSKAQEMKTIIDSIEGCSILFSNDQWTANDLIRLNGYVARAIKLYEDLPPMDKLFALSNQETA